MQADFKELCRITSERTGREDVLYKDIANIVLKEVHEALEMPQSLITKVKGIGFWFIKKKAMSQTFALLPQFYKEDSPEHVSSLEGKPLLRFQEKKKFYDLIKARLEDYEAYITKKSLYKLKKDEFDKLHKSKEDSRETSED